MDYREFFRHHNELEPYDFQVAVAQHLAGRRNIVIRAPTGSGKTLTVLTPFLYPGWAPRPARLIYAVPLRTLGQGIYQEARELAISVGEDPDTFVRLQTGEQPDDPFFTLGRIIVTTYDQVLSGLLSGPYGLSPRLHNVNSAAIAGALVVFDEFHLMEPHRAFLTGTAGLHLFRDLAQTVWMTATATSPLVQALAQSLDAIDASPSDAEVAQLPSVASVRRRLSYSAQPLAMQAVLDASQGRTIAICNTVIRAQALEAELRAALPSDVPVILLHARFFKPDRDEKVTQLKQLFGRGSSARAVLIATQVIEAGVDISCDDLHTEMCPMNALVQRSGRCARYQNERGCVHVYALPAENRAWLPYGDLGVPDRTLDDTQRLLQAMRPGGELMSSDLSARWVEEVHRETDRVALVEGWKGRLEKTRDIIGKNSIQRNAVRVSEYIREESADEVRVLVSRAEDLPERPGSREAVTVSRWQIRHAFDAAPGADGPIAWCWDFGDRSNPAHWEPLTGAEQLPGKFIVCLDPRVASYTEERGLVLGEGGTAVSPYREEPKRPGYQPLHRESWSAHALAVAQASEARAAADGLPGWLAEGFYRRFHVSPDDLHATVRATGLLHDLGKLQRSWQRWAAAWQTGREPTYRHVFGLAHTDFDPDNPEDRARARGFSPPRPPHATASAYAGLALLPGLLPVAQEHLPVLASACLAALLSHHGAWLPTAPDLGIDQLWERWELDVRDAGVATASRAMRELFAVADRRREISRILGITTDPDQLLDYWPLVAYLMRTLRLADQRATSEGTEDD